jgi:hypothetical protein
MKKKIHTLLTVTAVCFAGLFLTGCDFDEVAGFAVSETGGEYVVTDTFDNTLTFTRDQARQIADLGQDDAQAFLDARFRSKFPESYADPEAEFAISEQRTVPVDVQVSPGAQALAEVPGTVAPGVGTAVSVGLNTLLGLGLIIYRQRKLKQLSRKDAALNGAGRLIDGIYNVAEVMPDKDQGRRVVRAVEQGLDLVESVAGAAEELKQAVKRTETPSIDTRVYE